VISKTHFSVVVVASLALARELQLFKLNKKVSGWLASQRFLRKAATAGQHYDHRRLFIRSAKNKGISQYPEATW
jgi:hypothetical protein